MAQVTMAFPLPVYTGPEPVPAQFDGTNAIVINMTAAIPGPGFGVFAAIDADLLASTPGDVQIAVTTSYGTGTSVVLNADVHGLALIEDRAGSIIAQALADGLVAELVALNQTGVSLVPLDSAQKDLTDPNLVRLTTVTLQDPTTLVAMPALDAATVVITVSNPYAGVPWTHDLDISTWLSFTDDTSGITVGTTYGTIRIPTVPESMQVGLNSANIGVLAGIDALRTQLYGGAAEDYGFVAAVHQSSGALNALGGSISLKRHHEVTRRKRKL